MKRFSALLPTRTVRAPGFLVMFSAMLALGLAALALVLGTLLKDSISKEHRQGGEATVSSFASAAIDDGSIKNGRLTARAADRITNAVARTSEISGLRVWDREHRLLYGSSEGLRGDQEMPSEGFRQALRGHIDSGLTSEEEEAAEEEGAESFHGATQLEVYVPVNRSRTSRPHAVVEGYLPHQLLKDEVVTATRRLYLLLGGAAILLYLALLPTLIRSSRVLSDYYVRTDPALQRRLRRAIRKGELVLYWQPKLDLRTGRITGVEALLRWRRRGQLVPPGTFLPQAEQSEVMKPLTLHVAELAFAQCARWRKEGLSLGVAVNLSPANLDDEELPAQLARLVQRHGVLPEWITLEITETAAMGDPERAMRVLKTLGGLGFRLSIDDFGTGQSSLARLGQLPLRELKIDLSLTRAMEENDDPTLVRTIIGLAHQLELWVVAEGVEHDAMRERLRQLGCDIAQGYLISKPVEVDGIAELVADYELRSEGRAVKRPNKLGSLQLTH